MSEHLSAQQLERYRRRALPPMDLLMADDHLATCAACRHRAGGAEQLSAALSSLSVGLQSPAGTEIDHLRYEQLAAYADEQLDEVEREIVESHLEWCRPCAAEAQDLRAFKATVADSLRAEAVPVTPPTRWEEFVAFWRAPAHWVPLQVAVTAAVAALCVWAATHSLRHQVAELRAQLSRLQQSNATLQQEFDTAKGNAAELRGRLAQLERSSISNPKSEVPDSPLIAVNDGGQRITLDQAGHFTGLDWLPPAQQSAVKNALQTARIETPAVLRELAGKAGTLLGSADDGLPFALHSPLGTVVSTDRPTFRWSPFKGATSYVITVYDHDYKPVVTSGPLSATAWRPGQPLRRGDVYSWQVTALQEGKEILSPTSPAPEARFKVLEPGPAQELEQAKQTQPNSHLALGVLYAQAGLLAEAEREFKALLRANPDSPLAQKLLRSIRAKRR